MKKLLSFLLLSLGILGLAISEEIPSDGTAVWEYTPISGTECLSYYQISDDNNTCYFATWLLPSNAYASGYSWKCNDPYKKERYGDSDYSYRCSKPETASYASSDRSIPPNGYTLVCDTNPCRRVKIPDNAYASTSSRGWSCKSEYKLSGNSCLKNLYIPPNAYASNDGWTCLSGYKQSGNSCVKNAYVPPNASASDSGPGWYCNYGWIQVGNICECLLQCSKPKKIVDDDKVYSAASGSGFAVTSDGYVITNYHVIKGCTDVYIHDKGESILSTIVTFDPNNDIALLKGNFKPKNFYPLSRESTKLLTEVYVAGHPFGRDISTSVKVTRGIVSSLTGVANNFSNLQIDASLQPGNSGGPIMNDKGNVIGVAVAKLDLDTIVEDYGVVPENVNFGVKANVVINIMESENIKLPKPNLTSMQMSELGEMITDGTYYLSCWMTMAQINKARETKVIFKNFN
jgi:S1-C subfamily serine protease